MTTAFIRSLSAGLLLLAVAGCSSPSQPAAAPSTDVNPITGTRGGSGAK